MNNEKMGQFIAELRKSSQMTQRELAAKLNITDKAVSKWERGLSSPDISLLTSIAEIFGVSTGELLNGERNGGDHSESVDGTIDYALQYAGQSVKTKVRSVQTFCAASFTLLLLAGIVSCVVCDVAISGSFTWSLIPISSIVFGWLVLFPPIKWGEKGIAVSLAALTIFTAPYLWVLSALIEPAELLLSVGIRMAAISILFLWVIYALFRLLRPRWRIAASISLLLGIPVSLLINYILSGLINEPLLDIWDVLVFAILALSSTVLLAWDFTVRKRRS